MSATAAPAHPLAPLAHANDMFADFLCKDIRAIPPEVFDASPMGVARSPKAIAIECGGVNFACASILRGEPTLSEEEAMAKYAHVQTKEQAIELVQNSIRALNEAGMSLDPGDLQTEVTAPWGAPVTKQFLFTAMSYHLSYHDGQLNYFQCLHGDCEIHWND